MGYAIADALAELGARVDLISGPVSIKPESPNVQVISVTTADQMFEQTVQRFEDADGAVLAAAVSDYKPAREYDQKVKRTNDNLSLELEPTRDIAQKLGSIKHESQLLVGFALETQDEVANAKKKIRNKNLDWIVLNSLNEQGAGFQVDTNKISIIGADGRQVEYPLKSKKEVARDIAQKISEKFIR
jgi:phosphopantothenoylcysteine decarboxylase/phosphopantothenate--cysteine ligase